VTHLISRILNYEGPGDSPSVTIDLMRQGEVGVALSVLYTAFDEVDLTLRYASPPQPGYIDSVIDQLELVERDIAGRPDAVVVHSLADLDDALREQKVALVHAVEGGFVLSGTEEDIRGNVERLAARGVTYVTIAHLFWRRIATNARALPFMPQWLLDEASLSETFDVLDAREHGGRIPVMAASHGVCRFGDLEYNLTDATIRRIAGHGGVIGIIACTHYVTNGLRRRRPRTLDDSIELVCAHVDRIREVTGSFDHAALGTDLDGYIKPALPGMEHMGRMAEVQRRLRDRYGAADAEKLCSQNALRVVRARFSEEAAPVRAWWRNLSGVWPCCQAGDAP
jgi:microsomal dipeptidase-like Zn-dependent dipeptidase